MRFVWNARIKIQLLSLSLFILFQAADEFRGNSSTATKRASHPFLSLSQENSDRNKTRVSDLGVLVVEGEVSRKEKKWKWYLKSTMDNFTTNFSLSPFQTSNGSFTAAVPDFYYHYRKNGTASWDFSLMNAHNLKYSKGWTAILATAYSIIFLLGFVGNVIVILVISLKPRMRTVTNLFILNLAVADLLVVLFCVPVTLVANIFIRKWTHPRIHVFTA